MSIRQWYSKHHLKKGMWLRCKITQEYFQITRVWHDFMGCSEYHTYTLSNGEDLQGYELDIFTVTNPPKLKRMLLES